MTMILRWFEVGGRRHRAWFRQTQTGRELVIGGPGWQAGVGDVPVPVLEDLSEGDLLDYAAQARSTRAVSA